MEYKKSTLIALKENLENQGLNSRGKKAEYRYYMRLLIQGVFKPG